MTHIISITTARDVIGLSKAVEDRRLLPYMDAVHKVVEGILGETLYDRLIGEIDADADLTGEADLLELRDDYLKPFIAWELYKRSFSRLYAEFDRNGAHYKNDGNTVQAGADWMKAEAASIRDQADTFQAALLRFLKNNSGTGEPFEDWKTVTDDERGNRINRTDGGGIYFPRRRPKRVGDAD